MLRFLQEAEAAEPAEGGGAARVAGSGASGDGGAAGADGSHLNVPRQKKSERKRERLQSSLKTLASMAAPTQRESTSRVLSIGGSRTASRRSNRFHLMGDGKVVVKDVKEDDTAARNRRCAAYSHVDATRKALGRFISDADSLIVSEVGDDATMWARKPPDRLAIAMQKKRAAQNRKLKGKRWGRNTAVPVLTLVQHLACIRPEQPVQLVQVHAPSMALPKANWATILSRKRKWNLVMGDSVGENLKSSELQDAMRACSVLVKLNTNDAANTNDCMTKSEQVASQSAREDGKHRLHLDLYCQGHQTCLLNRPLIESAGDYETCIVRLGNILSHNMRISGLLSSIDMILDNGGFVFKLVLDLPPEHHNWQTKAHWILVESQATNDLSEKDVEAILSHDNSDWSSRTYTHFCLGPERCKAGCKNAADSLEIAKMNMRISLGMGLDIALKYRWKHMDTAKAYCTRGRGQHDLLSQGFRLMWQEKDLNEAEVAVAIAQDLDEVSFAVKMAARASSVIRCFDNDPECKILYALHAQCKPLEAHLNRVMLADKNVTAYVTALHTQASDCEGKKRASAATNLKFLSGHYGCVVVQDFSAMILNDQHTEWQMLGNHDAARLECQRGMVMPMVQAFRRLVHCFVGDPRFQVFSDLFDLDGSTAYSNDRIIKLQSSLECKMDSCDKCLDPAFAVDALSLLRTAPRRAHRVLSNVLPLIRVGSAVVERAHLYGQELKPKRSRGVGCDVATLAIGTYIRSCKREAAVINTAVEACAAKNRGSTVMQYRSGMQRLRISSTEMTEAKVQRICKATTSSGRRRSAEGYRHFRSDKWNVKARVGSDEFKLEEKRIADLWARMLEEDKAFFSAKAETAQLRTTEILSNPSMPALQQAGSSYVLPGTANSLKATLAKQITKDIDEQVSAVGLQMMSAQSALKPELVTNLPHKAISGVCNDLFGYDGQMVRNPNHTMVPLRSCHILNWGLCDSMMFNNLCKQFTLNVYNRLKSWKYKRDDLPIVARLDADDERTRSFWMIGDWHGKGETVLMCFMRLDGEGACRFQRKAIGSGKLEILCGTSQMGLNQFLTARRRAIPVGAPEKLVELSFAVMQSNPVRKERELAFDLLGVKHSAVISLVENMKVASTSGTVEPTGKLPFGLTIAQASRSAQSSLAPAVKSIAKTALHKGFSDSSDSDHSDDGGDGGSDSAPVKGDAGKAVAKAGAAVSDESGLSAGERVGIVGFGEIKNAGMARASCWCCRELKRPPAAQKFIIGGLRFWWRPQRANLEKSLHVGCVLDASVLSTAGLTERHCSLSFAFLNRLVEESATKAEHKDMLVEACKVFRDKCS